MRHRKKGRVLRKTRAQQRELVRSLARHLVLRGTIETTEARAKEMRPFVERLVTYAKKGGLAKRRLILAAMKNDLRVTEKLMSDIAPRYKERVGGYTRIVKTPARKSDSAARARIAFV